MLIIVLQLTISFFFILDKMPYLCMQILNYLKYTAILQ